MTSCRWGHLKLVLSLRGITNNAIERSRALMTKLSIAYESGVVVCWEHCSVQVIRRAPRGGGGVLGVQTPALFLQGQECPFSGKMRNFRLEMK